MKRLNGRIAVITGGSKGIGKAIALALASEGCDIAISARTREGLRHAAAEIEKEGVRVLAETADVRNQRDVQAFAQKVEQTFGRPHFLINNAGIGLFSDVLKMSAEDFRAVMETNLFGVFYCTQAFLPGMIENQTGHIVNISSLAGKNNFAEGSAYCASKHALISFGECLMLEVRNHNIKVTTICPGTVQTDFGRRPSSEKSWALSSDDVSKTVLDVLTSSPGSLVSLLELRPLRPAKNS